MNISKIIQEIKIYQNQHKERCVSTSHTFPLDQAIQLIPAMSLEFGEFDIKVRKDFKATFNILIL